MSRFRLYTMVKGKHGRTCIMAGCACVLTVVIAGYAVHSIGTVGAKSRETVSIYTEEELEQYLLDEESEEYNLSGRYRLEENLDLSWLEKSIGTNLEPFTGKFDGNGHVISGLTRPLFGVTGKAEIGNLLLEQAEIVHPFTYSDGERYVDGYAALVAYAKDTVIENCGMTGEIYLASPSEAEYQIAKASPSDAEERNGPGADSAVESSGDLEPSKKETMEIGPGTDTGAESNREAEGEMESESETEAGKETEPDLEVGKETELDLETESGQGEETEPESSSVQKTEPENGSDQESGSESAAGPVPDMDHSAEAAAPTEHETEMESPVPTKESAETPATGQESESGTGPSMENGSFEGTSPTMPMETIGYRQVNRQFLTMKVPAVVGPAAELALPASPADASPSDAELKAEESSEPQNTMEYTVDSEHDNGSSTSNGMTEEYIGNPAGDICLLVTAERVVAGGIAAEAAGNTLISNSFTLVNISSQWSGGEIRAGGMVGILDMETRVENSYASGLVDCGDVIAGFAAVNEGQIQNCYSTTTVSHSGTVRGAFTAVEHGSLSGCVYDRQMACVADDGDLQERPVAAMSDTELESAEFTLRGMNTTGMTGDESQIPGNWYTTAQAYPQITYFAEHGQEMIAINSRVSAIALILPEGLTLEDAVSGDRMVLPAEIDGQTIQWETEEPDGIKTVNTELVETEAVNIESAATSDTEPAEIEPVNLVMLQARLSVMDDTTETEPEEVITSMEETTGTSVEDFEDIVMEETVGITPETFRLKAQINGTAKTFQLQMDARTTATSWDDAVIKKNWDETYLRNHTVTLSDGRTVPMLDGGDGSSEAAAYVINSPEAFAWFVYQYNNSYSTFASKCVTLGTDLDFSGELYGGSKETPLLLSPMGTTVNMPYTGIFDGAGMTIDYLYINSTAGIENTGMFRTLAGGTVKNITVGKNSRIKSDSKTVGAIAGGGYGTIENCTNYADITAPAHVAGIIATLSSGTTNINRCGNWGTMTSGRISGGIVAYTVGSGTRTVTQCYNMGTIKATGTYDARVAGICPGNDNEQGSGTSSIFSNCYNAGILTSAGGRTYIYAMLRFGNCRNSFVDATVMPGSSHGSTNGAKLLTTEQMKSWAAAYALNGQKTTGVWKYTEGEYPTFGQLEKAQSWEVIGQGVEDGLITAGTVPSVGGSSTYSITTPEEFGVTANWINNKNQSGISMTLEQDIDLTGTVYGGTEADPVHWNPLGSSSNSYTGSFDGKGHTISHMKVEYGDYAGLFGVVSGSGNISRVGVSGATIAGTRADGIIGAGGIAGQLKGNASISRCYNRGGTTVTANGATAYAGGLVGQVSDHAVVGDSYHLDSAVKSTGTTTYAGGIAGDGGTSGAVKNCYNACGATTSSVTITASGTGAVRSIAGTGGTLNQCYSETLLAGDESAGVKKLDISTDAKIWEQTEGINTYDGIRRTGTDRVWFSSLGSEITRGLPTFVAPEMIAVSISTASDTNGTTQSLGQSISDALLRGVHQDGSSSTEELKLTASDTVKSNFSVYGTTNANASLGIQADSSDLGSLPASMLRPDASAGSIGTFNRLTLYNGAGYTRSSARLLIIDVVSGSTRYEISVTVPGATSKTLSVTLPVKAEILLESGVKPESESAGLVLKNDSDCPVQVGINSVTAQADKQVQLKPIAGTEEIDDSKSLEKGGVKLGIRGIFGTFGAGGATSEKDIFYTPAGTSPATAASWLTCNIGSGQKLDYRYVIQHSMIHAGLEQSFGFDIVYEIKVPEEDVGNEVTAVVQ